MTERALTILQHNLSNYELKECDILIDPFLKGMVF
jgi:hypothetical protein